MKYLKLYKTWFSTGSTQSACSVSSLIARMLLYGDVMTSSSTDGQMAVTIRHTSGNSSFSRFSTLVPRPEPVPQIQDQLSYFLTVTRVVQRHETCFSCLEDCTTPILLAHVPSDKTRFLPGSCVLPPPIEWMRKKHCRQSQCSAAFLSLSTICSLQAVPYIMCPTALEKKKKLVNEDEQATSQGNKPTSHGSD